MREADRVSTTAGIVVPLCNSCIFHKKGTISCKAFEQIPLDILTGKFSHTEKFGGEKEENGKPIIYVKDTDKK